MNINKHHRAVGVGYKEARSSLDVLKEACSKAKEGVFRKCSNEKDPAVQFSIAEDPSKSFSGENYRSNLLCVYEFFRRGNTQSSRCLLRRFMNFFFAVSVLVILGTLSLSLRFGSTI
jgi:hypothetical protein